MKKISYAFLLSMLLILGACSQDNDDKQDKKDNQTTTENQSDQNDSSTEHNEDHSTMEHSSSAEVPEGLEKAEDPKYPVDSKAIIETDHMPGMKGAEATIVGAYDTTAYIVSYNPTNGGKRVKNHKWVIQEELKDADKEQLKSGDKVVLEADHMKGMKGAEAVIDSAKKTTVYMIDYTPTNGGEKVKNHKWVTEDELSPAK